MTPEELTRIESQDWRMASKSAIRMLAEEIRALWAIRDTVKRLRTATRSDDVQAIQRTVFELGDALDAYERRDAKPVRHA